MSNKKSILTGVMLTAGTCVGAGMFSLPVVSSGMWFGLSIFFLFFVWYLSYLSGLYLLEVNSHYEPGASFNTLVNDVLGPVWNTVTGLSIAFLLYILLYAYFSAFGSIVDATFDFSFLENISWSKNVLGFLFGGVLAVVIWASTKLVGRISTIFVTGMVITFILSMGGFSLQVEVGNLINQSSENSEYLPYIWAGLPYFVSSFGFAAIVPSLYKFYGKNPPKVKLSMLIGSLLALVVYCIFLYVVFGNISRDAFVAINAEGGNIGDLIHAISSTSDKGFADKILKVFSNFAIITSFLGVGLGLFDYVADLFSFPNNKKGRFFAACIAFLPPGILSFFFPKGFIAAIGYAGFVAIFSLFVIPFLMVLRTRQKSEKGLYKVKGGNLLLGLFIFSSIAIGCFHLLAKFGYLPKW